MENVRPINYFEIVSRDWRKLIVVGLIVVLLGLALTFVQPFLYRAAVSVYVVQKSSFSIDAYSASKSEERIANKLAQIIYSSTFMEQVMASGFRVDKDYLPSDEYKRRQKWAKMIEAVAPAGLSKLEIKVYHQEPEQALQFASAIAYILTSQKKEFIGIEDVDLKLLDSALVSKYPVRPNVFLNLLLSVFVGLVVGAGWVIATYNPRRDKLFKIGAPAPHLVNLREVLEKSGVENEIKLENEVQEISDLEEVEELKEAEESADETNETQSPDVEVDEEVNEEIEESDRLIPPKIPGEDDEDSDLPKFGDEDQIIGMPKDRK